MAHSTTPEQGNNATPDDDSGSDNHMDDTQPSQAKPKENGSTAERVLVDAKGKTPNPRSCITCRRRKVRCDKLHPCANCTRAHIECIFPAPGRAPRKARKLGDNSRDKELLERLRRLEGVVKGLGAEVPGTISEASLNNIVRSIEKEDSQSTNSNLSSEKQTKELFNGSKWVEELAVGRFENKFGRLVINEGRSRYVNNSFWANLSNEVEDLKGILNQSSEDDYDASPGSLPLGEKTSSPFVFGFSSMNVDMLPLHPLPAQVACYWNVFKQNVDPLVKILHVPTLEPVVLNAATHLGSLPKGFESLIFAIYYGAVTSLNAEDCAAKFKEDKAVLLSRYRFGVEQALARANFLISEELVVLQAILIFLICLRRNCDARVIWTLTGLVVRLGQTMGVHRDGTHFGLSPFETEMRRRAWWQICILDTRASEDHGCDPTIVEAAFDSRLPLNVNDTDLTPDMKEFPAERQGCTDTTFCLIRCEVSNTLRRINYIPPGPSKPCMNHVTSATLQDKEKWIAESHQRLEEKYLKDCDMSVPLFWVTATVARMIMSKMWLMVYHPFQRQDGGVSLPPETREKLFIASLQNMEYSLLLETETRTQNWGWLFKTYMQWHALAFILSEMCTRTKGEMVERAWTAIEQTRRGRWGDMIVNNTDNAAGSRLWRPLRKLYHKAADARKRGLQEEELEKQRASGPPPTRTYSPNANPMFGHPRRPQMTRAPLSTAQIQRFTEGPVFGDSLLDPQKLLQSPRNGDLDETGNMAGQLPLPTDFTTQIKTPQLLSTTRAGPGFGTNFLTGTSNIDYSNIDVSMNEQRPDLIGRQNSGDSAFDATLDSNAEMNWESWDQLVRQFGMDVDSNMKGATNIDWNSANWDMMSGGANQQTGMRMNGDWF